MLYLTTQTLVKQRCPDGDLFVAGSKEVQVQHSVRKKARRIIVLLTDTFLSSYFDQLLLHAQQFVLHWWGHAYKQNDNLTHVLTLVVNLTKFGSE